MDREHFFNKKILLIRHGEASSGNDPGLSEQGIEEIQRVVSQLSSFDLKGFVGQVSPMRRCLETAHIIASYLPVVFDVNPDIMETTSDATLVENRWQCYRNFYWPCRDNWNTEAETKLSLR